MTREIQTANLRIEEVAETVLPRQVKLLRDLIGFRTVSTPTPTEAFTGAAARALDLVEAELRQLGFAVDRWMAGDGFPALAARHCAPEPAPTIGFNGHLDVVPIEDPAKWQSDPWGGTHIANRVYGRGAC